MKLHRGIRLFIVFLILSVAVAVITFAVWHAHVTRAPMQISKEGDEPPVIFGARMAAEWEPAKAILIAWPLRLPEAFVRDVATEVALLVTVADDRARNDAQSQFASWGIPVDRVDFVTTEQGDGYYGSRDWGPHAVFDGDGRGQLVDARYIDYPVSAAKSSTLYWLTKLDHLSFRAEDDAPAAVARVLGLPRIEVPVALTGGSIETDGRGTAFVTEAVLEENEALGVPRDRFLSRVAAVYGLRRVIALPKFEALGVHHIDCLLKLLGEDRIVVKRPPRDHFEFHGIEKIVKKLRSETSVHGTPYRVFRIDTPRYRDEELANYTNALILNAQVYVPLFGIEADETALARWRELLPDHEVRGYLYGGEHGWSYTDALHCRTKAVWGSP